MNLAMTRPVTNFEKSLTTFQKQVIDLQVTTGVPTFILCGAGLGVTSALVYKALQTGSMVFPALRQGSLRSIIKETAGSVVLPYKLIEKSFEFGGEYAPMNKVSSIFNQIPDNGSCVVLDKAESHSYNDYKNYQKLVVVTTPSEFAKTFGPRLEGSYNLLVGPSKGFNVHPELVRANPSYVANLFRIEDANKRKAVMGEWTV